MSSSLVKKRLFTISGFPAAKKNNIRLRQFFLYLAILSALCFPAKITTAQAVAYGPKTSPNIEFTFNSMSKYMNGITVPNALTLNIDADLTQWDLYVGATTTTTGQWDVTTYYSGTGTTPDIGIIQLRFRNTRNTALISGFFPLTDIATPTDIIGNHLTAPDATVDCDDPMPTGANVAGNYITRPECYRFLVDLRIIPGLNFRAGLYTLRIDFILARDL